MALLGVVTSPRFTVLSWTNLLLILAAFYSQRFVVLGVNARMLKTDGTPESAEIITPTIVGDIGHTDGPDGNHWARRPNSHQSHLLVLKLDLKNSTIRLNLRQDIVALTVRTEWIGENHTSLNEINRKCMFEGTLDGATEPTATVSICNGITGTIGTPDGDIYIRPVASEGNQISSPHRVWMIPGSDVSNVSPGNDETWSAKSDSTASRPVEPRTKGEHDRHRRSTRHLGIRYMQVLVVTDQTVVRFHGREVLEEYILTQMSIVNNVYHHPSLGVEINVVVSKITVLDEKTTEEIVQANDGLGTLGRFCRWTGQKRLNDIYSKVQFDVAIYLTREELGSAGKFTFSDAPVVVYRQPVNVN
ncbi:A disintegrin and metalloproteinase with thrombospondin motifs 14 [Lamellibrachia satsuma]|nr:A disintegrin and metalloproteinase with thrombospondin motifs 14 [Lamellibrachia satsuma]